MRGSDEHWTCCGGGHMYVLERKSDGTGAEKLAGNERMEIWTKRLNVRVA